VSGAQLLHWGDEAKSGAMRQSGRTLSNATIALASAVLLLTAGWGYLLGYPPAPVDPAWEVEPAESIPEGALTVRYAGTATLLFSDGETHWMTDGWFSRPGPLTTLFGEIAPDLDNISFGMEAMGVGELAAVIPVHSHYDHAMDTPEVARRTGATVHGSEATANICRGWGLSESQIAVMEDGAAFQLGDFVITPIVSRHFQFPDPDMVATLLTDSEIPEPLVPPVSAFDYKLGEAWVLHVAHPKGSFLIVGSAGFIPGLLAGMDVDVIFLGAGGVGSQTADYREQFWAETVGQTRPERIFLIHWDSLTGPLDGPMTGEVRIAGFLSAGAEDARQFWVDKAAADPDTPLLTLPRFQPFVLFP
jgi:L-ascorbate metabolism protein UlaG (beta-lactamase superfamily)